MEIALPIAANRIQLRSKSIGQKLNINRDARTIDDVIIMEVGEADGHGFEVEASYLQAFVTFVKKQLGGRLQCNMGHRWDANFFQMGWIGNVRLSDDGMKILGKLTVYEAADSSPVLANMATWFFDLISEDAQAAMLSATVRNNGYYQYDDKKQKVYVQADWFGPHKQFKDKPVYAEFGKAYSADIVDQGALTSSLFSDGAHDAARSFDQLINAHDFPEWFAENESRFPFFRQFYHERDKGSFKDFFTNLFSKNPKDVSTENQKPAAETTAPAAPVTQAADTTETTALSAAIEAAIKPLNDKISGLQADLAARDQRIAALEKKPAADPVQIKTDDPARVENSSNDDKPWMKNPINQQAAKYARTKPAEKV